MSGITDKLRAWPGDGQALRDEAANYIERLQAVLIEAEPYVETLHSLMGKSDTRKQVMAVIRKMRALTIKDSPNE